MPCSFALQQKRSLIQEVIEISGWLSAWGTRFARKVASVSLYIDMAALLRSSTITKALDNTALESRYHSLERSLQLAYAVNDHIRIAVLESEIERLTGWRFSKGRR